MNSLPVALAIAGGLILAAVIAHGQWRGRQGRLRQADEEGAVITSAPVDSLPSNGMGLSERREPGDLSPDDFGLNPDATGSAHVDLSSPLDNTDDAISQIMAMIASSERKPSLSPIIDSIAKLNLETVLSGEAILANLPATRRVGSKPLSVEALVASGPGSAYGKDKGMWEFPQANGRYKSMQMGVQLANRTGALHEIEFSEFVSKVQEVSEALGAEPEFADMMTEVARARKLDQFASTHDAHISLYIFSNRVAWSLGYLMQVATKLGFIPGAVPGRLVLPSTQGQSPYFSLDFDPQVALTPDLEGAGLKQFKLALEVPQVARENNPFDLMRDYANTLAKEMDARVADENGEAVSEETLNQIAQELQALYDRLDEEGLSAGSSLAKRLFS